jgi:hypothetical protein
MTLVINECLNPVIIMTPSSPSSIIHDYVIYGTSWESATELPIFTVDQAPACFLRFEYAITTADGNLDNTTTELVY